MRRWSTWKVCPLQNVGLETLGYSHQFNQGPGEIGTPASEGDGNRILVDDGEVEVTLLTHPKRPVVQKLLGRRTGEKLKQKQTFFSLK